MNSRATFKLGDNVKIRTDANTMHAGDIGVVVAYRGTKTEHPYTVRFRTHKTAEHVRHIEDHFAAKELALVSSEKGKK